MDKRVVRNDNEVEQAKRKLGMLAYGDDRMLPCQVARRCRVDRKRRIMEANAKLLIRGGCPGNRTLNLRIM